MTTIYLVRHAHAGDRGDWDGEDVLRPLSRRGRRQAEALAEILEAAGSGRVLSSPYVRCRQTVEPLAARRGVPVEEAEVLVEGTPFREALALAADAGSGAVLCTHGDIVADLVVDLQRRQVPLAGGAQWEKASAWMLTLRGNRVAEARYVPPPRT